MSEKVSLPWPQPGEQVKPEHLKHHLAHGEFPPGAVIASVAVIGGLACGYFTMHPEVVDKAVQTAKALLGGE
jgi:hypothetical protein